mmetsp:Transcript_7657/g.14306  ORF Transcript_7657/g.14306 Transcript_7657/m.14306 type:complete len:222 (+) Transcript_7657:534-1199(+)
MFSPPAALVSCTTKLSGSRSKWQKRGSPGDQGGIHSVSIWLMRASASFKKDSRLKPPIRAYSIQRTRSGGTHRTAAGVVPDCCISDGSGVSCSCLIAAMSASNKALSLPPVAIFTCSSVKARPSTKAVTNASGSSACMTLAPTPEAAAAFAAACSLERVTPYAGKSNPIRTNHFMPALSSEAMKFRFVRPSPRPSSASTSLTGTSLMLGRPSKQLRLEARR